MNIIKAIGGLFKKDQPASVTEARKRPGGSNVGRYETSETIGPAGGAPKGSYPIDTRERAHAALAYARHAPNPAGIKSAVCRKYPDFPSCKEQKKGNMVYP